MRKLSGFLFGVVSLVANDRCFAKEKHSAHEHGKAKMDVAVEGKTATIEFESPSISIYGFEHEPKSDKEKKARDDAAAIFKDKPSDLFVFEDSAKCIVTANKVEPFVKEDHDDDDDHHKEAPTKATKGAKKSSKKHEEHEKEHGEHGEFHAELSVKCEKDVSGTTLKVNLFNKFSHLEAVQVQVVSDKNQTGAKITKSKNTLKL